MKFEFHANREGNIPDLHIIPETEIDQIVIRAFLSESWIFGKKSHDLRMIGTIHSNYNITHCSIGWRPIQQEGESHEKTTTAGAGTEPTDG